MIRREIPAVCVTAEEAGKEFADSPANVQADFLLAFQSAIGKWAVAQTWPMQCRFITDEMPAGERKLALVSLLKTLTDHLDE